MMLIACNQGMVSMDLLANAHEHVSITNVVKAGSVCSHQQSSGQALLAAI
jgi:hypothetical protein